MQVIYVLYNKAAIDLLNKMLKFLPEDRITAEDALNHEYFSKYNNVEKILSPNVDSEFKFESKKLELEEIKNMLLYEILLYNDEKLFEEFK